MTNATETVQTIRAMTADDVWSAYVGDQSTDEFVAYGDTDDIADLTCEYVDACEYTKDFDDDVRVEIADKLAEHIAENAAHLTAGCRAALQQLRSGSMRVASIPARVRLALAHRGLVAEHTDGLLELTPSGRGVDPSTFEA